MRGRPARELLRQSAPLIAVLAALVVAPAAAAASPQPDKAPSVAPALAPDPVPGTSAPTHLFAAAGVAGHDPGPPAGGLRRPGAHAAEGSHTREGEARGRPAAPQGGRGAADAVRPPAAWRCRS